MMAGTDVSCALCAALQRRSPATSSKPLPSFQRADDHGLQHPVLGNGVRQFLEVLRVHLHTGLKRVGFDQFDVDLAKSRFQNSFGLAGHQDLCLRHCVSY